MDLTKTISQTYTDQEILCFYRKNKSYGKVYRDIMLKFSSKYLSVSNPDNISEYEGEAEKYIDLKKYSILDYTDQDFGIYHEVIDEYEVLIKERYFRGGIDYYDAHDLIISATKYFIELFKNNDYKILITQIVDNYVMDIMCRVAKYYNIEVFGIVLFFFPGYIRITHYGEHNIIRNPEEKEVDEIYAKLESKSKTLFNLNRKQVYKEIARQYFTYKAKYVIHYLLYHKLLGKLEYDYASAAAQKYPKKISNFFVSKYFTKDIKDLGKSNDPSKSVYIPLHFYPEATTEYWVDSPIKASYYPSLLENIKKLSNGGYTVYVKEHPAFYLKREKELYKTITSMKNVFLISPFVSGYDVLDVVDFVLVWTGTSGIESLMQGKKVITVSENYYSNKQLCSIDNMEQAKAFNSEEKRELIHRVLQNCAIV